MSKKLKILLFATTATVGVLLTLYVEYYFIYAQQTWLGLRILLMAVAIGTFGWLPWAQVRKWRSKLWLAMGLTVVLFGLNLTLRSINIYDLHRFTAVTEFCLNQTLWCQWSADWFFRLKLYRFVSLTSYFFSYILIFLVGLLAANILTKQAAVFWQKLPESKIRVQLKYAWLFYILVVYLLLQNLTMALSSVTRKTVAVLQTLPYEFEDRWEPAMGGRHSFGWIDTYTEFVNQVVPPEATILIPEQTAPWEMEGNPYYIRWFLYPRDTVQRGTQEGIPESADFALLTYGVFGYHKEVFPNFSIPAEKIARIFVVDRNTLEITELDSQFFEPEAFTNQWGVIVFK